MDDGSVGQHHYPALWQTRRPTGSGYSPSRYLNGHGSTAFSAYPVQRTAVGSRLRQWHADRCLFYRTGSLGDWYRRFAGDDLALPAAFSTAGVEANGYASVGFGDPVRRPAAVACQPSAGRVSAFIAGERIPRCRPCGGRPRLQGKNGLVSQAIE